MSSHLFRLGSSDLVKGLVVAVIGALLATLAQWFNAPGFDWASFNYQELVRIAVAAGFAYLSKNFFSTSDGKFGGRIG